VLEGWLAGIDCHAMVLLLLLLLVVAYYRLLGRSGPTCHLTGFCCRRTHEQRHHLCIPASRPDTARNRCANCHSVAAPPSGYNFHVTDATNASQLRTEAASGTTAVALRLLSLDHLKL